MVSKLSPNMVGNVPTFPGTTIPDNSSMPNALGLVETALESISDRVFSDTANKGAGAIRFRSNDTGAVARYISEKLMDGEVSVKDFGAKGDGTTNDTAPIKLAVATGKNVYFPSGTYVITETIKLKSGQNVRGYNSTNFNQALGTSITNSTVGAGCFWYDETPGSIQRKIPTIRDLTLIADYPIKYNNETTATIADTGTTPYGMKGGVINCDIRARVSGTGIGISMSKCFDWVVTDCEIERFDTNVLIHGCDIGRIEHNRIRQGYSYQILELSSSTFGSQNEIAHNDILNGSSTATIFIKSTARHTRIYNNYLEHSPATPIITGFIDASGVNTPIYNSNTIGARLTTVIRDNRIDGMHKVSGFVYRYEPDGQQYGEICDVGSSSASPTAPVLYITARDGSQIDEVPFTLNPTNPAHYHFRGPQFGKWNGYSTNTTPSLKLNGTNLLVSTHGTINANGANTYLRARGQRIVLKNGFTNSWYVTWPAALGMFAAGEVYVAKVRAKTVSGTETLRYARILNGSGQSLNAFTVTTQPTDLFVEITTGTTPATDVNGIYFTRSNNGSDIEIEYIELYKKSRITDTDTLQSELNYRTPFVATLTIAKTLDLSTQFGPSARIKIGDRQGVEWTKTTATLDSGGADKWWFTDSAGSKWVIAYTGTITPEQCGAVGDCVWNESTLTATGTNDTTAVQAAIDYFQTRGLPGTVEFSRLYRITSTSAMGTVLYAGLHVWGDRIRLQRTGAGQCGLVFDGPVGTTNYRGLHVSGGYKTGSIDITTNRCIDKVGYTLSGATEKNAISVTLATASEASNFAKGDVAFIRTGQLLLTGLTEPDAELLIVESANTTTGVVTFKYPLSSPYMQERFLSGTTGRTTTGIDSAVTITSGGSGYTTAPTITFSGGGSHSEKLLPTAIATITEGVVTSIEIIDRGEYLTQVPTMSFSGGGGSGAAATVSFGANLSRYELTNVNDRILKGFHLDIDLIGYTPLQVLNIWGVSNAEIAKTVTIRYGYNGVGSRDATNIKCYARLFHYGRINNPSYAIAPSTGCSNWDIDLYLRSQGWSFMHLHESTKKMRVKVDIQCIGNKGEVNPAVSILARCQDIYVEGMIDTGVSAQPCVGSDDSARGGITYGPLVLVSNRQDANGSAMLVPNAPKNVLTSIPVSSGSTPRLGFTQGLSTKSTLYGCRLPHGIIGPLVAGKVTEFGTIHIDEMIDSIHIYVEEAFNGNGMLYIGYDTSDGAFVNSFNLAGVAAGSQVTITAGTAGAGARMSLPAPSYRLIKGWLYTGTTQHTTGKARVSLRTSRTVRF